MRETLKQKSNKAHPPVTLSIVSHGDGLKIERLLESIRMYEQADQFHIIVTDNLGQDFPEPDKSSWASFTVVRNEQSQGFARNHNQAFRLSVSDFFCILNPDVVFEQEVFSQLIELLKSDQADIVAPLIVDSSGVVQDSFRDLPGPLEIIRRRLPGYEHGPALAGAKGVIHPDWLAGIFLLLRSDTYRGLGGMNDRYRLYFEDVEFCTRARLAGLKLGLDTRVRVRHDAHRASRKKLIYLLWHLQSAVRFFTSPIYKKAIQKSK
jgi:N-acetylglucosaminyl-diphospho-decaprenol L-rhamnosyltransferase